MKQVEKIAAQGDVLLRRVATLPPDAVEQPAGRPMVIAHSETGHHHVVDGDAVLFEREPRDPLLCFLYIEGDFVDIVHLRPYDTHETLRLAPGVWEVRRQREWTLEEAPIPVID